tara:strand:+ start:12710 stop:13567 length:858 start_codon:yes stop_codon:yes gene_type:complete
MLNDISIYIPAYNAEKTIKQCLDSVLRQTIKPSKILVINDSSTDSTKNILLEYKQSIQIIDNEKNMGVSFSRNLALKNLKSKFVASIDADVVISETWLEQIVNSLQKNNATIVGGKMYEKFIDNPCNLWRSIRLKQHWGEQDRINPPFIFGCNNILDTTNLDREKLYRNDDEYYKLNGDDIELGKLLIKKKQIMYYDSNAICSHLQNDNYKSLAARYWRYVFYGDGLKNRNFFKTFKNIIRQIKKVFLWTIEDLTKLRLQLILVNFALMIHLIKLDIKHYSKNET